MTQSTSRRVGDLINDVEEGRLKLKPPFQRRLVWTDSVKDAFLETVLLDLPFPEIFVATGEIDRKTRKRVNWLVDGQQRITTLRDYVLGSGELALKKVAPYSSLPAKKQTNFLDYPVAVRDLGVVTKQKITDIFQRINSTDFSLKQVERLNALYMGAYRDFCEALSRNAFFKLHKTFSTADWRRMRDLDFCIILVTTLLSTYYNRSELNSEYLERYNDEFLVGDTVSARLEKVFRFVDKCDLGDTSRGWKKTDLLTLIVELDSAINSNGSPLNPVAVGNILRDFYGKVDGLFSLPSEERGLATVDADVFRYLKAATKATNDRYARVDRAEIISKLLDKKSSVHSAKVPRPKRRRPAMD